MGIVIAIPTSNRIEYLRLLLQSIRFQYGLDLLVDKVMVLCNSPDNALYGMEVEGDPLIAAIVGWLTVKTEFFDLGNIGYSPGPAYNFAMASLDEGQRLLGIDDDMVLAPSYLQRMSKEYETLRELYGNKIILSGVTPWVSKGFEDTGPEKSKARVKPDSGTKIIEIHWAQITKKIMITTRQNYRYIPVNPIDDEWIFPSDVFSPANFLMPRDMELMWSNTGNPDVFSDVYLSLVATKRLGYRIFFNLESEAWHMNAPVGGLRVKEGDYDKSGIGKESQLERIKKLLSQE